MLHSRHIVVADFPGGKTTTLYQGANILEAQKAIEAEVLKGEAETVQLFSHPMPTAGRYPLAEKAAAAERAKAEENAKNAKAKLAEVELAKKREQVKSLQAEIKKLS